MVNIKNNGGLQGSAVYQKQQNQQLEQNKQEVVKQSGQESQVRSAQKDSVALTPQANQLKELQKRIGDTEAFDRKKVDEIKKAISEGNYEINYDSLASKLAAFEFDL
jgi:negative regulator of flagellin synthesis FlgM